MSNSRTSALPLLVILIVAAGLLTGLGLHHDARVKKAILFREESTSTNTTLYYPYYKTSEGTNNLDASEPWIADVLTQKLKEKNVTITTMHVGKNSILVNH